MISEIIRCAPVWHLELLFKWIGILLEEEKRILQRGGYPTPRPLIVIECTFHATYQIDLFLSRLLKKSKNDGILSSGLLLLLKECVKEDRYINKSSHNKNVEAVMTFKKGCSNIIKVYYPLSCLYTILRKIEITKVIWSIFSSLHKTFHTLSFRYI